VGGLIDKKKKRAEKGGCRPGAPQRGRAGSLQSKKPNGRTQVGPFRLGGCGERLVWTFVVLFDTVSSGCEGGRGRFGGHCFRCRVENGKENNNQCEKRGQQPQSVEVKQERWSVRMDRGNRVWGCPRCLRVSCGDWKSVLGLNGVLGSNGGGGWRGDRLGSGRDSKDCS